jgi:hypothetical protein
MGLILSEPIEKVVEVPKIFAKLPVKTKNFNQNALPAPHIARAKRAGKKVHRPFFAEKKLFFLRKFGVFTCFD